MASNAPSSRLNRVKEHQTCSKEASDMVGKLLINNNNKIILFLKEIDTHFPDITSGAA